MNVNSIKILPSEIKIFITNKFSEFSRSNFARYLWIIAAKIKNFVLQLFPSPFVRPPEQQQTFDLIKKRYENLYRADVVTSPKEEEPHPLSFNFTLKFKNDSKPIQKLRLFARQIAQTSIECAQDEIKNPDLKKTVTEIAPLVPILCDIFSESICKTIQNISFEKMIDRISDIMNKEIKFHIQAQKATEMESKRLMQAIKICKNYDQVEIDYHSIDEWQYNEAKQVINQAVRIGKQALLNEVYANIYDISILNGKSKAEAKKEAQAAYKAMGTASSEKLCQEAYLRDFYLTTFVNNEGVTKHIKRIALANGRDGLESQSQDAHNYCKDLAIVLSNQLFSLLQTELNKAFLPNTFWQTYLTPEDALNANAKKNEILAHLTQPFITKNIFSLLQTFIIPQVLNEQLAVNILPLLEDLLVEQTCQYVITTNWKELSPYFYAFEIANETAQEGISLNISSRIKSLIIEKEAIFNCITENRFKIIVNTLLHNYIKTHKLIRQAILEQCDTKQFDDLIAHFYELVVICPVMPLNEQFRKRTSTLAYLKTSILVMLPQSLRKKGQSLWDEASQEGNAFYCVVTPLVDKIEKALIHQRNNTDQVVNSAFIKKSLLQFLLNDQVKTYPINSSKDYGEMIFNLGVEFGGLAPATKAIVDFIPGAHQYIKDTINKHVVGSIAPYRNSHKKIIKAVVDSLIDKFCQNNHKMIDKQKIRDILFKNKDKVLAQVSEESDEEFHDCADTEIETSMEQKIDSLALLSFSLFKQIPSAILPTENLQRLFHWTLEKTLTGDDSKIFATTLTKIQHGLFNHRLINLSRVARLSRIFIHTLKESEQT